MSAERLFALLGPLDWRDIDGDWLVYCAASGAMECVDVVGMALLTWLEDGPASSALLTDRLGREAPGQVPPDAEVGVRLRLQRWQRSGLVEPVDV